MSLKEKEREKEKNEEAILTLNDVDPVLDHKMKLVNEAINEIGWTNFHLKLFCLNGFGYMSDSLILLLQSITAASARKEFHPKFPYALTFAAYSGMLVGALFWGSTADIVGRKWAFNLSLLISSVFAIIAGSSPRWEVLATFTSLSAFGAGGNLILDTTVFLEYLPSNKQHLLTTLAMWWGLAPVIGGAFAWPLLSMERFNCPEDSGAKCLKSNNMGWRYIWFACGGLMLLASLARLLVIRLHETPKFLLTHNRDRDCVEGLRLIANRYHRKFTLTAEQLEACGAVGANHRRGGVSEFTSHLRGLFVTRKLGLSTILIWLSWTLIGLGYALYYVFLPEYLASRGSQTGESSAYYTWRNYLITNSCGILSPIIAGFMCRSRLGRKYTMVIGALITMLFLFLYTTVRTPAQNLGYACATSFCVNIYYATLYAYTPEVLPSAHRATGNGIAVACNRIMGLMAAVVAQTGNTKTSAPLYVSAAMFGGMAIVATLLPFEPRGRNSM